MKKVSLTPIMSIDDFLKDDNAKARGVYIWGFKFENKFYPYYIGKHYTDMQFRVKEHLDDLENGIMKVLDKKYLSDTSKYDSKSMDDCVYEHNYFKNLYGKSYLPKNLLTKKDKQKISEHTQAYLNNLFITYIIVPETAEEKSDDKPYRWVNHLERWIQDNLANPTASHPGNKYDSSYHPELNVPSELKHIFKKKKKKDE